MRSYGEVCPWDASAFFLFLSDVLADRDKARLEFGAPVHAGSLPAPNNGGGTPLLNSWSY